MNLVEQTVAYLDSAYSAPLRLLKIEKDGYGGFCRVTTSDYLERKDWDDGSFIVRQLKQATPDKTLRFGPLTVKMSEMYDRGYVLLVESFKHRKKHSLILRNSKNHRESYKVATILASELCEYIDLAAFVRDGAEPDYQVTMANLKTPKEIVKIVEKEIIKEVMIKPDPFDELLLRYPLERKPVEFVGNLTLNEYVKQQMKEHRRLHYVE